MLSFEGGGGGISSAMGFGATACVCGCSLAFTAADEKAGASSLVRPRIASSFGDIVASDSSALRGASDVLTKDSPELLEYADKILEKEYAGDGGCSEDVG